MSLDFILPDIGEGIVECELVEWRIKEGDVVKEDQPVADVSTDKALVEITSMHNGRVNKLYYQQGDVAKVHTPLFSIDVDADSSAQESTTMNADPVLTSPATENSTDVASKQSVVDFILPDIGEGIVECEVVEWHIQEGEHIVEDQRVADVSTDKALVEITSMYTGQVVKRYYQQGDIAKVHSPMFSIAIDAEQSSSTSAVKQLTATVEGSAIGSDQLLNSAHGGAAEKVLTTPAVRRLARENTIDLSQVPGTGKNGRVLKEDVLNFISQRGSDSLNGAANAPSPEPPAQPSLQAAMTSPEAVHNRTEPIKGVRAVMAKTMMDSVSTIPHFTYVDEIDIGKLISMRQQLKEQYVEQGIRLTMMPFFMKALSLAIKQFPIINSRANAELTELEYLVDHNIGMAVDSAVGLIVPNVKCVQTRSIIDIAKEVNRLTEQARSGRVAPEDLKGGSITLSNVGAIGGIAATPIINKPEVAIVALGKVQTIPRFDNNGQVVAKQVMTVSWSGDHRIIDGATMARFNNCWKAYLEDPASMLMAMS